MDAPVASLDDEAAALLLATSSWSLFARFERALILSRDADGAMISVVRHDVPDGPFTARLTRSGPPDLRAWTASPVLDLRAATRWRAHLVSPCDAVDRPELVRRLDMLDAAAARSVRPGRGADAVIPAQDLAVLEVALAADDARAGADVAARIAGLGPGLTPSGDDVLAGALAFHAWAEGAGLADDGGAASGAGAAFRAAVRDAAVPRTTRLAGQLLRAAARGHVAAPLAALLTSIVARGPAFRPELAPLLAIGDTSGSDMLTGVLMAGRALRRRPVAVPEVAHAG